MFRKVPLSILILVSAALGSWGVPTRDPGAMMRELQRAADQKQLWLVPDPAREFTGDFIARLRKEAAAGQANAQATLGLCHHLGLGVKRDPAKAAEWYRKAAAAEHPGAQNNLGLLYDEGAGVARDPAKALELYRKAADANYAEAQFNLALNYATGTVVKQDWAEAAAWYRKAADHGHLPAMNNLGNIYLLGRGVPVDLETARKYLRAPADAGIAVSQFGMGAILLAEGKLDDAAARFHASAKGGYPGGQFYWAVCLFEGKGAARDPKEALKWARIAGDKLPAILPEISREADALIARILLSEIPEIPPNPQEAYRRARRSAEQGYARGQQLLGVCYHRGAGVERDLATAIKWYRLAAAQKDPDAAAALGVLLETGHGLTRDFAEAAKWYAIAAEAGNALAQHQLGLFYRDGTGVEADLQKAAQFLRLAVAQSDARDAKDELAQIESQLAAQPAEAEFRRGLEIAQQAEKSGKSPKDALEHFRKAADAGHRYATAILAGMLRRGQGVPADDAGAEALIAKIENSSDPAVLHLMAMSYIVNEKIPANYVARAMGFCRRAALQGYPPAQNTLGFALMTGAEGKPDPVEAFKWLTLAAKRGVPEAPMNLARLRPTLTDEQIAAANQQAESFQPRGE